LEFLKGWWQPVIGLDLGFKARLTASVLHHKIKE